MSDWNAKVNDLFQRAAGLSGPDQRAAFLASECRNDAALRRQVELLLTATSQSENSQERLEAPAPGGVEVTITNQPDKESTGLKIGPYKLLQQIGEGGFGVVYMAEQEKPVRRLVALKVIKPGMDTAQVIARFESERQALAMMDHPNIAKVLDAGATETGRPYFVMELVKGIPITEFCDKSRMPTVERLRLFIDVCSAIQHAHQKGIIHRDIKPSNVMVTLHDTAPMIKVIDFGVAKATAQKLTERTMFTAYGQMIGTPAYMSPEQAEMTGLDIDTRSDIYSLGVLLYELLTGTTPLELDRLRAAGYLEMQRLIREEDTPRPSTRLSSLGETATITAGNRSTELKQLARMLSGDLDWIVMKALEKDRNRRYAMPGTFAEDIERYLRHEAIEARPPSVGYKLRKFAWRHRLAVVTGGTVVAALVLGTTAATWQAVVATQSKRAAFEALRQKEQAREAEAKQRKRAEENQRMAVASAAAERTARETAEASKAEAEAVLDFVESKVFAAARPVGQDGGLGHDVTLRQALEAALPFVETSFTDQPLIEARLRSTVGISFEYLGELPLAVEQLERARLLYTRHRGPDHLDTLRSMASLASAYAANGRDVEALALRQETLDRMKAKLGPAHPNTLISITGLAASYAKLARYTESVKLNEVTLSLLRETLGPEHPDTLWSMNNLAADYHALGRYREALQLNQATLALRKTLLGEEHPDTLLSMHSVVQNYDALGQYAEALKLGEETLAFMKTQLGTDHPRTLEMINQVAIDNSRLGRNEEAVLLWKELLALQTSKLGRDHPSTLGSVINLASAHGHSGRHGEALKLFKEALVVMKTKMPEHPSTFVCMSGLAKCYAALGREVEALKLHEETLAARKVSLGVEHPDTLASMNGLASTYSILNRNTEALQLHEEVLKASQASLGRDHPNTLVAMNNLAASYSTHERHAEAVEVYQEAMKRMKAVFGPDHLYTLTSLSGVVRGLMRLNRQAEALSVITDYLDGVRGKSLDKGTERLVVELRFRAAQIHKDLAGCLAVTQEWEKRSPTNPLDLYQSARFRAACSALIRETDPTPSGAERSNEQADQALAWLKFASAIGSRYEQLKSHPDFDAIRDREDFQQLLVKLNRPFGDKPRGEK